MGKNIIIIGQHSNGETTPATLETVACARAIQNHSDASLKILISGHGSLPAARQLSTETGIDTLMVTDENTGAVQSEIFNALPSAFYFDLDPIYICLPHNSFGMEIAPGLAMKLSACCISAVEKIIFKGDRLCFQRKTFNDKIVANMISVSAITVVTVQSGAFKPVKLDLKEKGNVRVVAPLFPKRKSRHLGILPSKQDLSGLAEAEVVVSAGNGIGKEENLNLIHTLAGLFPKSAVAGSRPVCDRKWLPYDRQVGATGATVKPKLYVACGISGASQHLAGMRNSKFIVSINTDPRAAIFQTSDVCIIEDLVPFISEFINAHQKSL
ncbi:MAG: electron transfer flavoprotein subunit alpha/FixB family protein [Desulfobacterales bacterium]|jgi:electron transfer flavoprotein alpha subunit|nr:electron transfer flavoprotein subunit alpha/FixB family protein [Desulfobacterales bacterium]